MIVELEESCNVITLQFGQESTNQNPDREFLINLVPDQDLEAVQSLNFRPGPAPPRTAYFMNPLTGSEILDRTGTKNNFETISGPTRATRFFGP